MHAPPILKQRRLFAALHSHLSILLFNEQASDASA